MRILVISDSHKRSDIIEKILYAQGEATHVFFLGDLASDIEELLEISDENWFVRAIISYQTIIELMVYGYCKRTTS